ncbi:hypothetical protein [Roseovarius aestuarii]|uniref:Uncharacterized protein n=1 Tax=Roseovarius aestuarii TaxID=475083 RepID=A0A1X7BNN2_9RHOB|nr:hypothetical protein [Roseovarius aestuarii]SMC11237.1 hypothetical protein ROA7745_01048 [Roseovarius aestuarii]
MDNSGNSWRKIIGDLPVLKAGEVLTFGALFFALYVGGTGAFLLGVVFGLPSSVVTLINHATIVHLSGQLTFIALIIFALFKVSRLFVIGSVVFFNFLICKFYFGLRKSRGLRDPVVARLQRRRNKAVVEGRSYGAFVFGVRIIMVLVFSISTFLPIETGSFITYPSRIALYYTILFGGIMAILGLLSAYRVADKRTHREFFNSPEGWKLAFVATLFLCMVFGMARTFTMMQGPTVRYALGAEVCQLAPMMPVYGGNLYFDRESYNFVVISSDKIAVYVPHQASKKAPACI